MGRIIVFDVNETLLDLGALDPHFERVFGDGAVWRQWFQQVLQSALLSTVLHQYRDFTEIQHAALQMIARRHDVSVTESDAEAIVGGMKTLPAHPDAAPALTRLRDARLSLAALTNSPWTVAEAQLNNAGLHHYFADVLSADEARHLKPAPEPYRMAADHLGVSVGEIRMVAAHAWDVAGAMAAGCAAAFLARPGAVLDPLFPTPDITGGDLEQVVERILSADTASPQR